VSKPYVKFKTESASRAPFQWGRRKGVMVCPVCHLRVKGGEWVRWHSQGRNEPVFRHAYSCPGSR
jgi:hypothetical protein